MTDKTKTDETQTTDTAARIERVLEKPDDKLAVELPALLEEIDGRTKQLLLDNPALFARVTQRMDAVDIAEFATEYPKTTAQFQGMLWTGMELLVQASPAVQQRFPRISRRIRGDRRPNGGPSSRYRRRKHDSWRH